MRGVGFPLSAPSRLGQLNRVKRITSTNGIHVLSSARNSPYLAEIQKYSQSIASQRRNTQVASKHYPIAALA